MSTGVTVAVALFAAVVGHTYVSWFDSGRWECHPSVKLLKQYLSERPTDLNDDDHEESTLQSCKT